MICHNFIRQCVAPEFALDPVKDAPSVKQKQKFGSITLDGSQVSLDQVKGDCNLAALLWMDLKCLLIKLRATVIWQHNSGWISSIS